MTLHTYLGGCLLLVVTIGPLAWAAVEARRTLLPDWRGAEARLGETVLTATLVLLVAEGLGTVGSFRRGPVALAGLAIGIGISLAARWLVPRRPPIPVVPPAPADPVALGGAAVAVVAVFAQWTAWTALAYRQGMTAYDALFYHSPLAARFAQTGDLTRLHSVVPGEAVAFYPATTETWHAVGMLAFGSDIASPGFNLVALAVALLAAWALGRRLGGAPATVAGVALVMTVPYAALGQAGTSGNDAAALAALLAAVALIASSPVEGRTGHVAIGLVAGLAAGLAAGIKLSFLAPAVLVGLAAVFVSRRRFVTAITWTLSMLAAGGYWYARNLARIGNPLPGIGSVGLPAPALPVDQRYGARLLLSLDLSARGWRTIYHPGLDAYFGRAWPAMVTAVVVAVIAGVAFSRRAPWHRAMGLAVLFSALAYGATPVSGDPIFFGFNLRYTVALQGLAVVILATLPALASRWAQRALVGLVLILGAVSWPGRSPRYPLQIGAWPHPRLGAIAVTVAAAGLVTAVWALWRLTSTRPLMPTRRPMPAQRLTSTRRPTPARRLTPAWRRSVVGAGLVVSILVAVVVAGRGVDDRYERGRYRTAPGGLGAAWRWAQAIHRSRIGVVGLYQQYPFYGPDLSNYVQYVGVARPHGGFARAPDCATWRTAVNTGRYRYVVTSRDGIAPPPGPPPERAWTGSASNAHVVLHAGDTDVFEITGPLDPTRC